MRLPSPRVLLAVPLVMFLVGCASGPITKREGGALTGATIGTGTGYIIGHVLGNPRMGAIAGGLAGGAVGAVVGDRMEAAEQERRRASTAAAAAGATSAPTLSPSPSYASGDPTAGVIVNGTPWTIALTLAPAADGAAATHLSLAPHMEMRHALDIGVYRVTGVANVQTQFGARRIGGLDRTFAIDPRAPGWRVDLKPHEFK